MSRKMRALRVSIFDDYGTLPKQVKSMPLEVKTWYTRILVRTEGGQNPATFLLYFDPSMNSWNFQTMSVPNDHLATGGVGSCEVIILRKKMNQVLEKVYFDGHLEIIKQEYPNRRSLTALLLSHVKDGMYLPCLPSLYDIDLLVKTGTVPAKKKCTDPEKFIKKAMARNLIIEELCVFLTQLTLAIFQEGDYPKNGETEYNEGFPKHVWKTQKSTESMCVLLGPCCAGDETRKRDFLFRKEKFSPRLINGDLRRGADESSTIWACCGLEGEAAFVGRDSRIRDFFKKSLSSESRLEIKMSSMKRGLEKKINEEVNGLESYMFKLLVVMAPDKKEELEAVKKNREILKMKKVEEEKLVKKKEEEKMRREDGFEEEEESDMSDE